MRKKRQETDIDGSQRGRRPEDLRNASDSQLVKVRHHCLSKVRLKGWIVTFGLAASAFSESWGRS
jgi:hypothetical protein